MSLARGATLRGAPRWWWVTVGWALGFGVAGCAHRAGQPPEMVHAFADAVAERRWDAAYRLMSGSYQRRVPLAQFRATMEAETATVTGDAAQLSRAVLGPTRAEIVTATGDHLALVLEDHEWKLDTQPLEPFGQESPRAALRTFVRAIDKHRYDILLRLVPAARRQAVTVATLRAYWEGTGAEPRRALLAALRASLNAPIVELGSEAQMPLEAGDDGGGQQPGQLQQGGEVRFLLEDGRWMIDDVK